MDKEIFASYKEAISRLKESLEQELTSLIRDAAIKRFELAFELAWKSIQKFLENQGIICRSPKNCFQEAFKFGLIGDNPLWLQMIEDRNLTVHIYNETMAKKIFNNLKNYLPLFEELKKSLKKYFE